MRPFHITIHAAPAEIQSGGTIEFEGVPLTTLELATSERMLPLPVQFESAIERLEVLPRMFVEMDGSFVWRAMADEQLDWQIDGVLYDGVEQLQYIELKGRCPAETLGRLLEACMDGEVPVILQLIQPAVYVELKELQRWMAS